MPRWAFSCVWLWLIWARIQVHYLLNHHILNPFYTIKWIFQSDLLTLKHQSRLQQTTNLATSFLIFEKNKVWYFMRVTFQQTTHDISCLICYFWKSSKIWNCRLLQIIDGALWVKMSLGPWDGPLYISMRYRLEFPNKDIGPDTEILWA